MAKARLMNTAEDYKRLKLNPNRIEAWEDGCRDDFKAGKFEWWYFDAILDDGTKIAAVYSTKVQPFTFLPGAHPALTFHITAPDGKDHQGKFAKFKKEDIILDKDKCNVHFGPHFITGDLKNYHLKAEPLEGLGFDLRLTNEVSSWRGETGYLGFEDKKDEKYFTWFCAVPKGRVEGTVTIDGVTHQVTGLGYHDHQWGDTIQFDFLNHWFWSRQNTDKHSIVVFDFVMNQHFEFERIPLVFLQDEFGNVLFESTDNVSCQVEEEFFQTASKTNFPKIVNYTFKNGSKTLTYRVEVLDELDGRFIYKDTPAMMRWLFKGSHPKYGRYHAKGDFSLYDNGELILQDSGDLIYEFAYVQDDYKTHMERN